MKKLALRIEALDVQSFELSVVPEASRGTVEGADSTFGSAIGVTLCTCDPSACQWNVALR